MELLFSAQFSGTLIRFLICILVNWGIVHFLYYRKSHRTDFYFSFMLMTVAIFFLVYFMMGMERGKATMGVGLGLFGIFSIMRYRTDAMPVREMTYLFLIVCLSVVHAMAEDFLELTVVDILTIISIILCEMLFKAKATKLIQYDRIEMVKPEKRQELKADLEQRLGLEITRVEVGAVDFLRDMAMLRIYYKSAETADKALNNKLKLKDTDYAHV